MAGKTNVAMGTTTAPQRQWWGRGGVAGEAEAPVELWCGRGGDMIEAAVGARWRNSAQCGN